MSWFGYPKLSMFLCNYHQRNEVMLCGGVYSPAIHVGRGWARYEYGTSPYRTAQRNMLAVAGWSLESGTRISFITTKATHHL